MSDWTVEYVRHVLDARGWPGAELAERAGVSASTINRPVNTAHYPNSISSRTLDKVAAASGIDYRRFAPATGVAEALPAYSPTERPRAKPSIHIVIDGAVARLDATVTRENIEEVRRKLDLIEALLSG